MRNALFAAARCITNAVRVHPFLLLPFLFYFLTCAPTIGLGDTALLIDEIQKLKLSTHANNHNFTVIIGWLFSFVPVGSAAYRGNLASVFLGGITLGAFYFLMFRMYRSRLIAATVASLLMVSHSMWWHSSIVECYAANALFTVGALSVLYRLRIEYKDSLLYTLFVLAGLAIFNHAQMGIIAIGAAVYLFFRFWELLSQEEVDECGLLLEEAEDSGLWAGTRLVLMCTIFFLVGFLPYLLTFLKDASASGSFSHTLSMAFGGDFKSVMFKGAVSYGLWDIGYLIFKQFPSPVLIAIPLGLALFLKSWGWSAPTLALLAMFLVNTAFFMFYNTWDKFAFLLPSFIILIFWASFAIARALVYVRERAGTLQRVVAVSVVLFSIAFPIYLYSHLSVWGAASDSIWHTRYNNDYTRNSHDCAEYIANPNKRNYYSVQQFADLLFDKLPKNSIYVDDDSRTFYPIKYFHTYEKKRRDLRIRLINSWGFSGWGLNQSRFTAVLNRAYTQGEDLYVITVEHPFDGFIRAASTEVKYQFDRIELDGTHWIYKLRTPHSRRDLNSGASAIPKLRKMVTGVGFDSSSPVEKKVFGPTEPIMVRLQFEKNSSPFPIRFQWIGPRGDVYSSGKEFRVVSGNTSVWSYLDRSGKLPAGRWRVAAFSSDKKLLETRFKIE